MSDAENTSGKGRNIVERVIITGQLELLTPTSLSNGDTDGLLDLPLSRDVAEGVPLLTGSSIAGALRNYLRLWEYGYHEKELQGGIAECLFGALRSNDQGAQSPLIVDDARALPVTSEIRDNVRIEPQTRTAQDEKKFDLELLPAGTTFDLRFELLIAEDYERETLLEALALALTGFEQREISLGARKRRGFGRCVVESWQVQTYRMRDREGLLSWFASELDDTGNEWNLQPTETRTGKAAEALGVSLSDNGKQDARQYFTITARFALASPLLIRSEEPTMGNAKEYPDVTQEYPDVTHLHAQRNSSEPVPLLPGTSLAGALRARAQRILNTLTSKQQAEAKKAQKMLDSIFGSDMDLRPTDKRASRLVVEESEIHTQKEHWLVQQRVSIDRFTGGAYDTALFSEAPLTGGEVELTMTLQGHPHHNDNNDVSWDYQAEVGVLLLLLKDLWTGDLPLGGTSSIGRGRLRGISACLHDNFNGQPHSWELNAEQGPIQMSIGKREELEVYVTELHKALQSAQREPEEAMTP